MKLRKTTQNCIVDVMTGLNIIYGKGLWTVLAMNSFFKHIFIGSIPWCTHRTTMISVSLVRVCTENIMTCMILVWHLKINECKIVVRSWCVMETRLAHETVTEQSHFDGDSDQACTGIHITISPVGGPWCEISFQNIIWLCRLRVIG